MTRRILPQRRSAETFDVVHGPYRFIVSIGYFDDGAEPAEIFVTGTKAGSDMEALARDGAVLLSLALQHGVPVQTIVHSITRDGLGAPSSVIGALADQLATIAPAPRAHTNGSAHHDQQIRISKSGSARRGGRQGGLARAAKLTAEQRRAIASKAASARWARKRGKDGQA